MKQILVVDEIGKMELFSNAFIQKIKQIFQHENVIILATVPIFKGKPIRLVEELKARSDCQLLTVSNDILHTLLIFMDPHKKEPTSKRL